MGKLTPEQAKKYVRERWANVQFHESAYAATVYWPDRYNIETIHRIGSGSTADAAWLAAAEYTRQHERKIAEVKEEIEWMQVNGGISPPAKRILAVLESQLAELTREWRQR